MTRSGRGSALGYSVGVIVFFLVALFVCTSKYLEFVSIAQRRGCVSNLNSLNKAVGVWESQNRELPPDREIWIDFASDGKIARVSPDLEAWLAGPLVPELANRPGGASTWAAGPLVPADAILRRGSPSIYNFTKDLNVFCCPDRFDVVSFNDPASRDSFVKTPELMYRFISSPKPVPELGGRKRGVQCLHYGETGPRQRPEQPHRPDL